jgi:hypothetical protein
MGMYRGPSYPDRPSSKELSAVEVDARILRTPESAMCLYGVGLLAPGLVC